VKTSKQILESMTLYKQLQKYKDRTMNQNNQLQKTMNATIVTGEYTDRQTGQKKKSYLTIGKLFIYNDGGMSLKLDALPLHGQNINFYDIKPKNQNNQQQQQNHQQQPNNYGGGNGQQNNNSYQQQNQQY